MIGAIVAVASERTTAQTILAAAVGGAIGCGLGILIARRLGRRWRQSPKTPADGLVLWVRVRTPEREQAALRILKDRGADAVHVHEIEIEIEKRLEDLPLSSLRADPWLGVRLGEPR
jgi:hypothetical protein